MKTVTVSQYHHYEPDDEIVITTPINNGFWKLVWHWLLQKPINRFNHKTVTVTKVTGMTFTYEGGQS